jgi:cation diffusion facilitator family transporter
MSQSSKISEIRVADLEHSHIFDEGNPLAERNTRWAVFLTVIMMFAEITGGWYFNSMALLADGWHMSSHALALGLSVFAYKSARHFADDPRFAFGTWKIEILASFTSAIFLIGIAGIMLFESIQRLISPSPIHYQQAIEIATIGLVVNLICAWLLKDDHHHGHDHHHEHGHTHDHHHKDLNQRSAYIHVLTDAATSVLAIIALFGGLLWGARWLDPVMGIVGAALVSIWAINLLRDASRILLDAEMDAPVVEEIKEVINGSPETMHITDLHVWRVGKGKYACILAVATSESITPEGLRERIGIHEELAHITVEINPLSDED